MRKGNRWCKEREREREDESTVEEGSLTRFDRDWKTTKQKRRRVEYGRDGSKHEYEIGGAEVEASRAMWDGWMIGTMSESNLKLTLRIHECLLLHGWLEGVEWSGMGKEMHHENDRRMRREYWKRCSMSRYVPPRRAEGLLAEDLGGIGWDGGVNLCADADVAGSPSPTAPRPPPRLPASFHLAT